MCIRDRPGRIDVSTAGAFDSVIGLIPFRSPNAVSYTHLRAHET